MAAPQPLSTKTLDPQAVTADRKTAKKYDQCGLGQLAIYMPSKYLPRKFYIPNEAVTNVYKRVAVSPMSGKFFLTPILSLVIRYDDGKEVESTFRYLDDADKMLNQLEAEHPSISLLSPEGEKKRQEKEEMDRKVRENVLSPEGQHEVTRLENAKWYLEKRPALTTALSGTARVKRSVDNINPMYQAIAFAVVILGLILVAAGIFLRLNGGNGSAEILTALAGIALLFVMMNSKVLPTRKRNKKALQRDYDKALGDMETYLKSEKDFPLPARYAHPYTCERLISILKEESAADANGALEVLKEDLKKMDNTVALSGDDYKQVVTIKPMFLVADYK